MTFQHFLFCLLARSRPVLSLTCVLGSCKQTLLLCLTLGLLLLPCHCRPGKPWTRALDLSPRYSDSVLPPTSLLCRPPREITCLLSLTTSFCQHFLSFRLRRLAASHQAAPAPGTALHCPSISPGLRHTTKFQHRFLIQAVLKSPVIRRPAFSSCGRIPVQPYPASLSQSTSINCLASPTLCCSWFLSRPITS